MIAYLEGGLIRQGTDYIVVNVDGVGYKVHIPGSLQQSLSTEEKVELHIYTYVREDAIKLYGFANLAALEVFEKLLGVSRVGPSVALGVLGTMSVRNFKLAVAEGNIDKLKQVKGVGKKTAKRLILELQEKLTIEETSRSGGEQTGVKDNKIQEAVQGLKNLGYSHSEARQVVSKVVAEEQDQSVSVEKIIRLGLNRLNQ